MDDEGAAYSSKHRAFLQAFISKATLSVDETRGVLAAVVAADESRQVSIEDITEATVDKYIAAVNAAISPYDLEIRNRRSQTGTRPKTFALVNTTSDPITQLATVHSPDEIAYVKRLLDEMFERNNNQVREVMAITSMQALKLSRVSNGVRANEDAEQPARAKDLTKADAEQVLQSMVDEGWFDKHRDQYVLSDRGLMELRAWLLETYNEPTTEGSSRGIERIKPCQGCRDIVTIGQRCSDRNCLARLHDNCAANFFRSRRNQQQCPLCNRPWTGQDLVGWKVATRSPNDGSRTTIEESITRDGEAVNSGAQQNEHV